MLIDDIKPIFVIVLRETDQWTVEVEWPGGTIEQAVSVKSASSARNWIGHDSPAWIKPIFDSAIC
jgi:hypothetical protein